MANSPEHKLVDLAEGLSIADLMSEEGATFEINFDSLSNAYDAENTYVGADVFENVNPECCDLLDEDTYEEGEPFEKIGRKMTNVTPDGKIKKRILREGYGSELPDRSFVTIHYNAYLEYGDEPFDSTLMRKKPFSFVLNEGHTLIGLDIAVSTMKLNEKSQFLIHYDYAYGKFGCAPRVPPESVVLFEVEVKNCVDSGACSSYETLSEEKQKTFDEIYKYCIALCDKAKDLFKKGMIKQAIKEYNTAVSKLEYCTLKDYASQEKQQELLFRLHKNLVITYTKIQEPRRACFNFNKASKICKGTSLKLPAKIHFQHARSLILLGDYDHAEKQLRKAKQLEPQNIDITREFTKLDQKRKENYDREINLAKAIFNNNKINKEPDEVDEITEEFEKSITLYCKELIRDADRLQYNLPDALTKTELKYVENEVVKHGLKFEHIKEGDTDKYFICKVSELDNK